MRYRVFIAWIVLWCGQAVWAEGVKAGFAERDITPEIGMEQPGGYGKAFHQKLHDPCKVRAAVFDDGGKRVALVGIDSLIVPRELVLKVRAAVKDKCGIEPGAVLIGASHTHTGGPLGMVQAGQFDHADALVMELAYKKSSMADPKYVQVVEQKMVEAIVAADAARAEVTCGFGSGAEEGLVFNRRMRMKNGMTFTHPGRGNPEIEGYAGPVDPQVGVIGVWGSDGKLAGCVVNFACHCTCGNPGISADYVYDMERVIRGMFGPQVGVVFLNGASGDITQVDNLGQHAGGYYFGETASARVGGRIGAEAVKVLLTIGRGKEAPVAFASNVLKIPRRVPDSQRVAAAYEVVKTKDGSFPDWVWAKETVMLDAIIKQEPVVDVEVQAVQVGPAVFVTTPAEYFCQYGLDIKKGSKFPFTYPVSLANGCVGYVPTEEAFGEHGGGYETRLTSYSNLRITAGREMADAGIALTQGLTPGSVPQPPPTEPFKAPWTYGNVPPQKQ